MPTVRYRSLIPAPASELFAWHERPGAFERLMPPWQKIEIAYRDGSIRDGDRLALNIKAGPVRKRWLALHSDYVEGRQFRDTQAEGPFRKWVHTHRVHPAGDETSILDDQIDYELPGGAIAAGVAGNVVARQIRRMFRFRHLRTRNDLLRHQMFRNRTPISVAILGSGSLADQLRAFLTSGGHAVADEGRADFVVDLSHLDGKSPISPHELQPDAAWISVLPRSAEPFNTLRFPRHMTIWTPDIVVAGSVNPVSRTIASIGQRFVKSNSDATLVPWLADDDLVGAIHTVIMDIGTPEDVMACAPSFASVRDLRRIIGRAPAGTGVDASAFKFHYLYPTLDIAVAGMNGRT